MIRLLERIKAKSEDFGLRPVTITVFGDSITMGAFEKDTFDFQDVYHNQLKRIMESHYPKTVFNVINSGVAGQSASDAVSRVERDVVVYNPDLTLVAFGMNDSNLGLSKFEEFRQSMNLILDQIQQKTQSEIVLLTPSFKPYSNNPNVHEEHESLVDEFVKAQREGVLKFYAQGIIDMAVERKLAVADVYGIWQSLREREVDTDLLLANGLNHPVRKMHKVVADLLAGLIIPDYNSLTIKEILETI